MNEAMTILDRFEAAVRLEPVDRTPVYPILFSAAPRLYGITQAQAWADHNVARDAILRCWREYGYDIIAKPNFYWPMLPGRHCTAPARFKIPGKQLGDEDLVQMDEQVLFERTDYDKIIALGWNKFWDEHYPKISKKTVEQLTQMQSYSAKVYKEDMQLCESQGAILNSGAIVESVLMALSMCRTLLDFTQDLYEIPDKVEKAMEACCDDLVGNAIQLCKNLGKKTAAIVLERGSGAYYKLDIFERFELPFLQRYVDALLAEGIMPVLHMDTDWSRNIPYLKTLPKGKVVCDLDSTTDIFKAKEVLRGHMCISGDVPASLLSVGKPEEVAAYCRRLIDEVGDGGGHILNTGCECPIDVKPENLRAMIETGKTYKGKKHTPTSFQGADFPAKAAEPARAASVLGALAEAVVGLRMEDVLNMTDAALGSGEDPLCILNECRAGMDRVGEMFSKGDYFLGELILSANIFKTVVEKLEPHLVNRPDAASLGALVIATPKGDIHDLGKNIVATLLKASGFEVHDLGVDVEPERIVDAVEKTGAKVVGMSALITPTFESMKKVVDLLKERGLRDDRFVIVGGGVVTGYVKDYVGADEWTLDPTRGVELCRAFVSHK